MIHDVADLIGVTLSKIEVKDEGDGAGNNNIIYFTSNDDRHFRMYHGQECCEHVYIEDVTGDLDDLIGSPIIQAEETSEKADGHYESATWTFYKLATIKGSVTIRWFGSSKGYYSEYAFFEEFDPQEKEKLIRERNMQQNRNPDPALIGLVYDPNTFQWVKPS